MAEHLARPLLLFELGFASGNEVKHEGNQRQDQDDVDKAPEDMEEQTTTEEQDQNECQKKKHCNAAFNF
jgi:hypothetical protein